MASLQHFSSSNEESLLNIRSRPINSRAIILFCRVKEVELVKTFTMNQKKELMFEGHTKKTEFPEYKVSVITSIRYEKKPLPILGLKQKFHCPLLTQFYPENCYHLLCVKRILFIVTTWLAIFIVMLGNLAFRKLSERNRKLIILMFL
jgi:hypothetical protein